MQKTNNTLVPPPPSFDSVDTDTTHKLKKFFEKMNKSDLQDPIKVLKIVSEYISGKEVDYEAARDAVNQTFQHHDQQLRVFLVAVAKAKLNRILKCMEFVETVEDRLFRPSRLEDATTAQLVKLYAFTQGSINADLDFINKITSMNLEIQKLMGSFGKEDQRITKELEGISEFSPESRNRMREALGRCLAILKDTEEKEQLINVTPGTEDSE